MEITIDIIDNNFQNIVNEIVQKEVKDTDLALSQYIIKKQNDEKQKLISWLEDKIKLCDKDIKEFSKNRNAYFRIIEDTKMCQRTYQDVLDYVKVGASRDILIRVNGDSFGRINFEDIHGNRLDEEKYNISQNDGRMFSGIVGIYDIE